MILGVYATVYYRTTVLYIYREKGYNDNALLLITFSPYYVCLYKAEPTVTRSHILVEITIILEKSFQTCLLGANIEVEVGN